jgi:hypothetical protein
VSNRMRVFVGVVLLIVITVVLVVVKCGTGDPATITKTGQNATSTLSTNETLPAIKLNGTVLDYIPHQVGMTWTYEITAGMAHPLFYWVTNWEGIEPGFYTRISQIPPGQMPGKTYELTLRVLAEADVSVDGNVYPGVELSILKDELGVYYGVDRLFWAFLPNPGSVVAMVAYVDDFFLGNDQYIAKVRGTEGIAMRPLLFDGPSVEEQHLAFNWDDEYRNDLLYFDDSGGGNGVIKFTRQVSAAAVVEYDYDKAFVETSVYEVGKGLTYLQQKVGSAVTMTWELVGYNFSTDQP